MIFQDISPQMKWRYRLLDDPKIANRPIAHDISLSALGMATLQPSRTRFLVHAPRYAYQPGDRIPLHCAAEHSIPLELLVVHDAASMRLLRTEALPAGTVSGDKTCANFSGSGCGYPEIMTLDTSGLPLGLLMLNFVSTDGRLSQPLFLLLRAAAGPSDARVALMHPDFTWQAYNSEGGASFYTAPPPNLRFNISVRRPIDQRAAYDHHNARSCLPFMKLMAEAGIPCRQFSNHDLSESARFLDGVEVLLLCGHDEYWTRDLRANIDAFIARGGRVACFSGNTNWWQAKLIEDRLYLSQEDKAATEKEYSETGLMFRDWVKNPIEPQLGLGYLPGGYAVRYYHSEEAAAARGISLEDYENSRGIMVVDGDHPIFADTGLKTGDIFGLASDIMHVEIDAAYLRGDGRLDRTRWRHTPRALKVLGRALIYTASFPSMNQDPEGLFHVAAVLSEVPGNSRRGAVIHGGSVGWYRAVAAGDKQARRIVENVVRYLLTAPGRTNGSAAPRHGRHQKIPASIHAGMADLDRRSLIVGAGLAVAASCSPLAPVSDAAAQTSPSRARQTLALWADLRERADKGDPSALYELASRLFREESLGAETMAEIYAMIEEAGNKGHAEALTQRYLLANERFDGLWPSSAIVAQYDAKLAQAGISMGEVVKAAGALRRGDLEAFAAIKPALASRPDSPEAERVLLALEQVLPSNRTPDFVAAARLLGTRTNSPLGLAILGQAYALTDRHREAMESFSKSLSAGYSRAGFLIARLMAQSGRTKAEVSEGLSRLQSQGLAGSLEALLAGGEIATQHTQVLADLAPYFAMYRALADKGYGNAAFIIAHLYAAGSGVAANPAEAVKAMEACARSRHRFAEFQAGVWAYQGYGQAVDKVAAARWFEGAAADGEPRAMFNLGVMKFSGDGIEADKAAGREWVAKAAKLGVPEATEWLLMNP